MIVFRADASSTIGGGHIYRCLTLAHAIKRQIAEQKSSQTTEQNIIFVCHLSQGHMVAMIETQGFDVLTVEQPLSAAEMRKTLIKLQQHHIIDWLIIDHYQINVHYEKQLKPLVKNLMVIDDLANRAHHCDLLFDQSLNRHPSDYQPWLTNNECGIICGSQFALLREEFSQLKPMAKLMRQNFRVINKVLIAISATDPENISGQIIEKLAKLPIGCTSKNWQYTLIITSKAKHLEHLKNQIGRSPLTIELKLDVDNMAEQILKHDIAIAAAGGSMLERCAMGLPSIIIGVVDNQNHIIQALKNANVALAIMDKSELTDKLNDTMIELQNIEPQKYKAIAENAFKLCQGHGADYLAGQLQTKNHFHNDYLQCVTQAHCKLIFEWQQHPKTRAYSRNPNPPTWDEHQNWFTNTINNPEINFYLVINQGSPVGFVRLNPTSFENQATAKEVSIAISPEHHSKGLGVIALNLLTALHNNSKLLAFIDENNIASVKAFERAGFKPHSQTDDGNWYQYK